MMMNVKLRMLKYRVLLYYHLYIYQNTNNSKNLLRYNKYFELYFKYMAKWLNQSSVNGKV